MTEDQKANLYGHLMNEHRRLHNLINEIKGSSIDPSKEELIKVKRLEQEQVLIMQRVNQLLSR